MYVQIWKNNFILMLFFLAFTDNFQLTFSSLEKKSKLLKIGSVYIDFLVLRPLQHIFFILLPDTKSSYSKFSWRGFNVSDASLICQQNKVTRKQVITFCLLSNKRCENQIDISFSLRVYFDKNKVIFKRDDFKNVNCILVIW